MIVIIFVILILLFEIIKCSKPYKKHIEKFYVNDGEQLGRDDMPIMHGSEISIDLDYLPCIKELNINNIGSSGSNCIGEYKSIYDNNVVGDCDSEHKHIIRDYPVACSNINYNITHSDITDITDITGATYNNTYFITLPDTKLTHYKSFTYDASRYRNGVHNESIEEEPLYEITPTMINNRYGSNTIEENNAGSSCNLDIQFGSSCNYNDGEDSEYSLKCLEKYYNEQSKTFNSDPHEQLIVLNTILKIFLEAENKECLIGNGEDKEFIGVLKEDTDVGVKFFAIIIDDDSEIKIEPNETDFVLYRKKDINAREKWDRCQYDNSTESSIRKKIMKIGSYAINNKGSTANIPILLVGSQTCAEWEGYGSCNYVDFGMDNSDSDNDLEINVREWIDSNGSCGSSTEEVLINCPNDTNTSFKTDGCDNSHLDYNLAYSIICDGDTNIKASDYVNFIVEDVTDYYKPVIKNEFIIKVQDSSNCYLLNSRQILSTLLENFTYANYFTTDNGPVTPSNQSPTQDKYICNKFGFSSEDIQNKKNRGVYGSSDFDYDPYIDESDKTQNIGSNIGSNVEKDIYSENVLYNMGDLEVAYTIRNSTSPPETNINNYVISNNISRDGYTISRNNITKTFTFIPNTQDKAVNMYRIWGDFSNPSNNPKTWTLTGESISPFKNKLLDSRNNITDWPVNINIDTTGETINNYFSTECKIRLNSNHLRDLDNDVYKHNLAKTFYFDNNTVFDRYILSITETESTSSLSIMEFKMYNRKTFNDKYPYRFSIEELIKLNDNKNYIFDSQTDKFKSYTNIFRNNKYYNIRIYPLYINIDDITLDIGTDISTNNLSILHNNQNNSATSVLTIYSTPTNEGDCSATYNYANLNVLESDTGEDPMIKLRFKDFNNPNNVIHDQCITNPEDNAENVGLDECNESDGFFWGAPTSQWALPNGSKNRWAYRRDDLEDSNASEGGVLYSHYYNSTGVLDAWNSGDDASNGNKIIKLNAAIHGKGQQNFIYDPYLQIIKTTKNQNQCLIPWYSNSFATVDSLVTVDCNYVQGENWRWEVLHKRYHSNPDGSLRQFNADLYKEDIINGRISAE